MLPLQALGGLLDTQLGQLLAALIVIGIILFVGRFVMKVAWKLVILGIVVVGGLWFISTVLGIGIL